MTSTRKRTCKRTCKRTYVSTGAIVKRQVGQQIEVHLSLVDVAGPPGI